MRLIEKTARYEIWHFVEDDEFAVYGVYLSGDPRVCPSLEMARAVAASI